MENKILRKNIKRSIITAQIFLLIGAICLILGNTLFEENMWLLFGTFICIVISFLFGLKAMKLKKKLRNN